MSLEITLFVVGTVWATYGLVLKTTNFVSSLLFKVFPVLSGVFVVHYASTLLGWI